MAGASNAGEDRWRVFVSSTSELQDFPADRSYVSAVKQAISSCGHVVVEMADFPATDMPAAELCRKHVRSCDVYVGVLGTRYGSPVREIPQISYSELEYDTATEAGLPRLAFLLDYLNVLSLIRLPRNTQSSSIDFARYGEFRRRVQTASPSGIRNPGSCDQTFDATEKPERSTPSYVRPRLRATRRNCVGASKISGEVPPWRKGIERPKDLSLRGPSRACGNIDRT